jgi:hypothetical protein
MGRGYSVASVGGSGTSKIASGPILLNACSTRAAPGGTGLRPPAACVIWPGPPASGRPAVKWLRGPDNSGESGHEQSGRRPADQLDHHGAHGEERRRLGFHHAGTVAV